MRRVIPSLLAVLGAVAALTLTAPSPAARAAACAPAVASVPDAVAGADAVVTVQVAKQDAPASAKPKQVSYKATVQHAFKGSATGTITVVTKVAGAVHSGCALKPLAAGHTYLLFLTAHGKAWFAPTDQPSTSDVAAVQPQVQAALQPPKVTFGDPLVGAPASLRRIAAPGAALVIIGLLGLLFVRRRRPAA